MHAYVVNMHICVRACCIYVEARNHSVFSLICFLSYSGINLFVHSFIFKSGSLTESGAK